MVRPMLQIWGPVQNAIAVLGDDAILLASGTFPSVGNCAANLFLLLGSLVSSFTPV